MDVNFAHSFSVGKVAHERLDAVESSRVLRTAYQDGTADLRCTLNDGGRNAIALLHRLELRLYLILMRQLMALNRNVE